MTTYPAPNDPLPEGYLSPETSELAHQIQLANAARLEAAHWQEQSRNSDKARCALSNEALDFVRFVQRHTLPDRAKVRTHEETYSIIMHHPFAKARDPRFAGVDASNVQPGKDSE
jgi:hypothetical protein